MKFEIKVPAMGESISTGIVAGWRVALNERFAEGDILLELETDKVTLEIPAPHSGVITKIEAEVGEEVKIGQLLAVAEQREDITKREKKSQIEEKTSQPTSKKNQQILENSKKSNREEITSIRNTLSPAVSRLSAEKNISSDQLQSIPGTGKHGQLLKGDLLRHLVSDQDSHLAGNGDVSAEISTKSDDQNKIVRMNPIRKRIAARLLASQRDAAILTTFNEVDMSAIMALRQQYKDAFKDKYQVGLGFMSMFTKIVCTVLGEMPILNARIQGENIVYHKYYHIGVAVGGPRGLVVPVIRNADQMSHAQIEKTILAKIAAIQDGSIKLEDLEGGTFTISNGGVYGSMLSTPIINPPQVGILGMHNIVKRPVVVANDEVQVRPIMYLALSYDHRLVDGKEAVTFLKRIKEMAEDPTRIWISI